MYIKKEEFRERLIKAATPAETRLLQLINDDHLLKGMVEFQKILEPYIVDFYFKSKKLAVELDGSSHESKKQYDSERTKTIKLKYGVKVIRFQNSTVFKNPESVITKIKRYSYIKIKHNQSLRDFYGINPLAVPPKKKGTRKKKAVRRNKTVGTVTERTKSTGR